MNLEKTFIFLLCLIIPGSLYGKRDLSYNIKDRKIQKLKSISENDFDALYILSKLNRENSQRGFQSRLSEKEKELVKKLFIHLWANPAINRDLLILKARLQNLDEKIDPEIVDMCLKISYKTQKNFDEISSKINFILESLESEVEIPIDKKINVREFRKFVSFVALNKWFQLMESWGVLTIVLEEANYKKIYKQVKTAATLQGILQQKAQLQSQKGGAQLIGYDFRNDFEYRQVAPFGMLLLENLSYIFQVKFDHLSLGFSVSDEIYEAHMWGKPSIYKVGPKPLASYLYQVFKINFSSMLPKKDRESMASKFRELYGDNWSIELDRIYDQVAHEFFLEFKLGDFSRLHNPKMRRLKSIVRSIFSYSSSKSHQIYFS